MSRTKSPPSNYDLVEIKNVNQIPKGSSFVVFPEGMYNLNETVYQMWGNAHCIVYYIVHQYKDRQVRNYFILYPEKEVKK